MQDIFVCDFIATIKKCQNNVYIMYLNPTMVFKSYVSQFQLFNRGSHNGIMMELITDPTTNTNHLPFDSSR
jgi:hypothetical protein